MNMNIINSYATPLFGYSLRHFLLCSYKEFITLVIVAYPGEGGGGLRYCLMLSTGCGTIVKASDIYTRGDLLYYFQQSFPLL